MVSYQRVEKHPYSIGVRTSVGLVGMISVGVKTYPVSIRPVDDVGRSDDRTDGHDRTT